MRATIPKTIHYCWFGEGPKNELIQRCIASWREWLPDYGIVEWNESNFDPASHPFAAEMYHRKKWAFLADYVRMWVLYHQGGVYLDVDVELFGPLDRFLEHSAFSGVERMNTHLSAFNPQCFGAVSGHPWIEECLAYYDSVDLTNSSLLFLTNTSIVSKLLIDRWGALAKDRYQVLHSSQDPGRGADIVLYPSWVLCLPNYWVRPSALHHFAGSWLPPKDSSAKGSPLSRLPLPRQPWLSDWQVSAGASGHPLAYYYTPPLLYPLLDSTCALYLWPRQLLRRAVRALKLRLKLDPDKALLGQLTDRSSGRDAPDQS